MSNSAIIDRIQTLLDTTAPFFALDDEERRNVLADVSIEYFEPGEVILEQGTGHHPGLFLVESGLVRLMDIEQQRLVDKCQEGDFFGSFGLLKGGATLYQAKAVEDTVCALIRVGRFQQLYKQNDEFQLFFDQDIRKYMRHLDANRDVGGRHLLLTRTLKQLTFSPPITAAPTDTVRQVAKSMSKAAVDTALVIQKGAVQGIVTDSDLRRRILTEGKSHDTKIRQVMSKPVHEIDTDKTLFDATLSMLQHGIHRLVVRNESGELMGVLSDRDIAHFRGQDPIATLRRIERAPTVDRLTDVPQGVNGLLFRLYSQGVMPEEIKRIMALMHDRLTTRVVELSLHSLPKKQQSRLRKVKWAWLRLGSGGRQEATLKSEQHNALVYELPQEEGEDIESILYALADEVNESLASCGFVLSEVVARDSSWRKPIKEWKKTYRTWIHLSDEVALKRIPFFFDMRSIYGNSELVDELKQDLTDALNIQEMDEERRLLPAMAENALKRKPPLSFFSGFVLERSGEHRNRLNIREKGILPIVDAARVLALDLRYFDSVNTFDRLRYAREHIPELKEEIEKAQNAYNYFVDFRLEHQLQAVENGEKVDNYIDPAVLSKLQRNLLKSAFNAASQLQDALAKRYEIKRGWQFIR